MVNMSFKSRMHMYSIFFLFVMVSLAISPFYFGEPFTAENISYSSYSRGLIVVDTLKSLLELLVSIRTA